MQPALSKQTIEDRMEQMMRPNHPLCREDIIWILDFIKKKVADEDPRLMELSQPRLMKNFHYFAKIAMFLIHKRHMIEADQLQNWVQEATHGLYNSSPKIDRPDY